MVMLYAALEILILNWFNRLLTPVQELTDTKETEKNSKVIFFSKNLKFLSLFSIQSTVIQINTKQRTVKNINVFTQKIVV